MSSGLLSLMRIGSRSVGLTSNQYKDTFLWSEVPPNASSGKHFAQLVHGEWKMMEVDEVVFATDLGLPNGIAEDFGMERKSWRVYPKGKKAFIVPSSIVSEETHNNVKVNVLLLPSAYDVRCGSISRRLVGMLGKTEEGYLVLVGLDLKRFPGATEFETVRLKDLVYHEKMKEEQQTSPAYSPGMDLAKKKIDDLTLNEATVFWFQNYMHDPNDYDEQDMMDDEKFYPLWCKIMNLRELRKQERQEEQDKEKTQETSSEDKKGDQSGTNKVVLNLGNKRLADQGKENETGETKQVKMFKDLNGQEFTEEEWVKKIVFKSGIPTPSEAMIKKQEELNKKNPFWAFTRGRHESE